MCFLQVCQGKAAIPLKQMALKKDQLYPGQTVSMDHFKVTNMEDSTHQEVKHIPT